MKALLQASAAAALISVTVLVLTLTVAVDRLEPRVLMTLRGLHASANETALTMHNLRDATAEWKEASRHSTEVELQAKADLVKFGTFIDRTDFQLNSQVLPGLRGAIAANSDQLVGLEKTSTLTLEQFSRDSSATLEQSKTLLAQISQDASDPAITNSFKNLEQTTSNTARITTDAVATMGDVRTGVHYELQQLMKPVNKAFAVAKIVATIAGKFLGY